MENVVSDFIKEELDIDSCLRVLVVADRINSTSLRDMAMELCVKNFYMAYFAEEISSLPFEVLLEILSNDALVVRCELDVFNAVLRWGVCSRVNDTQIELDTQIATRACELLVQYKILPNDYTLSEPESYNTRSSHGLFECVKFNNMSNNDLRLVQFCR